MTFDEFYVAFRELGNYQRFVLVMLCVPACFMNAFNGYGLVFLAYTPEHKCVETASFRVDSTADRFLPQPNVSLPLAHSAYSNFTSHECSLSWQRRNATGKVVPESEECSEWAYSTEYFTETLVSKWGLVCEREIQAKTMLSVVSAVAVLGCLLYAQIADRWGRRVAMHVNVLTYVVGASTSLFMPNLIGFTALRLISAVNAISSWNIGYIWALEYVGPSKRTLATAVMGFVYSIAMVSLAGVAYLCRDWQQLGLWLSVPFVGLLSYQWLVSESPQWCLSVGREAQAEDAVYRIIYWEGKHFHMDSERYNIIFQQVILAKRKAKAEAAPSKLFLLDLFRGRRLRLKTLLVCWCFVANAVVYTSMAYNTENLPGNLYVTWAVGAGVEGPATLLNLLYVERLGRVGPLAASMGLAGLLSVASAVAAPWAPYAELALAFVAKFAICSSYAIVYQLAGELFPTVVRSTGLGLAALVGDLGNISMPYIIYSAREYAQLPMVVIGTVALSGAVAALFLPETLGQDLPQTLQDAELSPVGLPAFHANLKAFKARLLCSKAPPTPEPVHL